MTQEALNNLISKTTLPFKENFMYILAEMVRIMLNDTEGDVKMLRTLYKTKEIRMLGDKSREFKMFCSDTQNATARFDRVFDIDMDSTLNWKKKDELRQDANELLRLVLLFVDRSARNEDNKNAIFKYIRSLDSCNIISEKEISRFDFKL